MDEELKERLELYQRTQRELEKELRGKKDEREREAIQNRIESCRTLIEQIYEKDNPTKKKEMYK